MGHPSVPPVGGKVAPASCRHGQTRHALAGGRDLSTSLMAGARRTAAGTAALHSTRDLRGAPVSRDSATSSLCGCRLFLQKVHAPQPGYDQTDLLVGNLRRYGFLQGL